MSSGAVEQRIECAARDVLELSPNLALQHLRGAPRVATMRLVVAWIGSFMAALSCGGAPTPPAAAILRNVPRSELRTVADFDVIADRAERSRALFREATRVLLHPRCANCHPSGDVPHQGNQLALHDPPVVRGPDDRGVPGNGCTTCHQDRNQPHTRVPGAPNWHLAPLRMAWVGKSPGDICRQMKDPARNGNRDLAKLVEHNAHDELVAWGWHPGADREPAPGNQRAFGELVQAWVDTGAECPAEKER